MLETLREYGRARLVASREAPAVRRRHAAYYLALAEQAASAFQGPHQLVWLERLEREHANLREALRWAVECGEAEPALRLAGALGWFWEVRGYLTEGRQGLAASLALPEAAGRTVVRAKALDGAGLLAHLQGDHAAAHTHFEEALALRRELGDKPGVGLALENARPYEVEAAAREERGRIPSHARCMLYRAAVEDRGPRLSWHLQIVDEAAARRFFPVANPYPDQLPDLPYVRAFYRSRPAEDTARMARFAESRVRANEGYTQDFRVRRADGELRWLRQWVDVTPRGAGRWEAVGVVVDVTDEKRLEEARLEEARLRAAKTGLEQFAYTISHDLKAPLVSIQGLSRSSTSGS